jgi:hypothetical protein
LRREAQRDHIQHQLNSLSFYDSVPLYDTDRCSSPTTAHHGLGGTAAGGCSSRADTPLYDHHRHYRLHAALYPNASFCHQPPDNCVVPRCRHRHHHNQHQVALRHAVSASDADYDNFRRRLRHRSTSFFRSRYRHNAKMAEAPLAACRQRNYAGCCNVCNGEVVDAGSWPPAVQQRQQQMQDQETIEGYGEPMSGPYWIRLDDTSQQLPGATAEKNGFNAVHQVKTQQGGSNDQLQQSTSFDASNVSLAGSVVDVPVKQCCYQTDCGVNAAFKTSSKKLRNYRQLSVEVTAGGAVKQRCDSVNSLPTTYSSCAMGSVQYGCKTLPANTIRPGIDDNCEIFTHV